MSLPLLQNIDSFLINALIHSTLILILFLIISNIIYKNKHATKYNFLFIGLIIIIFSPAVSNLLQTKFLNLPKRPVENYEKSKSTTATPEKEHIGSTNKSDTKNLDIKPIEKSNKSNISLSKFYKQTCLIYFDGFNYPILDYRLDLIFNENHCRLFFN